MPIYNTNSCTLQNISLDKLRRVEVHCGEKWEIVGNYLASSKKPLPAYKFSNITTCTPARAKFQRGIRT